MNSIISLWRVVTYRGQCCSSQTPDSVSSHFHILSSSAHLLTTLPLVTEPLHKIVLVKDSGQYLRVTESSHRRTPHDRQIRAPEISFWLQVREWIRGAQVYMERVQSGNEYRKGEAGGLDHSVIPLEEA